MKPAQGEVDDPDADLVAQIARGDARAVRSLVDRRLGQMLNLARRMLGDEAEAEDVAQEVFLRVWRAAPSWRPGRAKFETWMHRVALNLCYDRLRKRREVFTDAPPDVADEAPGAVDRLHERDVAARVDAALLALPERQRAAITLCAYQEMTNIEAAAAMDVSVEAIESLLARGRRRLRAELAADVESLLEGAGEPRG